MTRRRLLLGTVVAVVAGTVAGGVGALALQGDPERVAPRPPPVATRAVPEPEPRVLLVWTHGGLPPDVGAHVGTLAGVDAVTTVRGGDVDLTASATADGRAVDEPPDGWALPIDAIAVDASTYATFVPEAVRPLVSSLAPGRALLGTTSAMLRRLSAGASLELGGRRFTVAGVVDDALVGAAEVVVAPDDGRDLGLRDRYLLVAYHGDRAVLEGAVRAVLPSGTAVRFRGPGETPFLRDGDAVLPQALVKARFGEFAYRRVAGRRDVAVDAAFEADHIVTASVPLLGRVRCHRAVIDPLRGALAEIEASGLADLVDRRGYAGCYVPRAIAPSDSLSRHAWGVAFDLDVGKNPTGLTGVQDPRLVAVMRRWGFTSGSTWLVPDAAHFEYVRPPQPDGATK